LIREDETEIPTHSFAYEQLSKLGFVVNKSATKFSVISDLMKFIENWESKRQKLDFFTDGIVIKINDRALYESLGIIGKQGQQP
jgi:DNA ligase (NAD+)